MLDHAQRRPTHWLDHGPQLRIREVGDLAQQGVAVPLQVPDEQLARVGGLDTRLVEVSENGRFRSGDVCTQQTL